MVSHRTRALIGGVSIVLVAIALLVSPGLGVGTLTVSTPLAGSSISGLATVEGTVAGHDPVTVTLGLAPQMLGDCGVVVTDTQVALLDSRFTAHIATTALADGDYCLIAMSNDGRVSTVVGDIAVTNSLTPVETLAGVQLPTESLGGDDTESAPESPVTPAPDSTFATATMLGAIVLGATAVLALLVLGLGLWARQRTKR